MAHIAHRFVSSLIRRLLFKKFERLIVLKRRGLDTQIGVCFERLILRMPSLRNMVQVEVFVSKFHVSQAFFLFLYEKIMLRMFIILSRRNSYRTLWIDSYSAERTVVERLIGLGTFIFLREKDVITYWILEQYTRRTVKKKLIVELPGMPSYRVCH